MRSFGVDRQTRPLQDGNLGGRFFPRSRAGLLGAVAVLLSVLAAAMSVAAQEDSSEPFDPIKENGEYFVDWGTPDLALVVTGLLDGYIEPCGCAGMDRMKGGLSRRADFLKGLRADGWPVVAVDAGLITAGYGFQEELKFDMAINAFYLMGYSAIGISQNELRFPAHYLLFNIFLPISLSYKFNNL